MVVQPDRKYFCILITGGKTQEISVPPVEGIAGGGTSYGWVNGGLQGSSLGTSVIDPTKVHSTDILHVWSMPSTANVSQQEAPRPLEHVSCILFYQHCWKDQQSRASTLQYAEFSDVFPPFRSFIYFSSFDIYFGHAVIHQFNL